MIWFGVSDPYLQEPSEIPRNAKQLDAQPVDRPVAKTVHFSAAREFGLTSECLEFPVATRQEARRPNCGDKAATPEMSDFRVLWSSSFSH